MTKSCTSLHTRTSDVRWLPPRECSHASGFAPCSFELQNKIGSEDKAWCLETRFATYDVLPQSPGTALLLCWFNKFIHETTAWFAQFSKLVRAVAQFAREPTQRIRFNWVGGKRSGFGNGTLQTLEPAVFEALRTIRDGSRYHPLLAGPRNAEETLDQVIRIIDDRELHDAVIELLKTEGREPTLAPS